MKLNKPTLMRRALSKGVGGGLTGSISMVSEVSSLLWLRTAVSYQYKNGTSGIATLRILNQHGGIRRFYNGFGQSLIVGSLIRFGDVFANTGVLELLDQYKSIPLPAKTFLSTVIATSWRVFLMPLDTRKTMFQVYGGGGKELFIKKIRTLGIRSLYGGSLAATYAAFLTHYPWFVTYNLLYRYFPDCKSKVLRNGLIGFVSSIVAVCTNNAFKVMKLQKQASLTSVKTYRQSINEIGAYGMLTRGLGTRIWMCGIQGFFFSVCWKYMEEKLRGKTPKY